VEDDTDGTAVNTDNDDILDKSITRRGHDNDDTSDNYDTDITNPAQPPAQRPKLATAPTQSNPQPATDSADGSATSTGRSHALNKAPQRRISGLDFGEGEVIVLPFEREGLAPEDITVLLELAEAVMMQVDERRTKEQPEVKEPPKAAATRLVIVDDDMDERQEEPAEQLKGSVLGDSDEDMEIGSDPESDTLEL
jgi:hypothetical protein